MLRQDGLPNGMVLFFFTPDERLPAAQPQQGLRLWRCSGAVNLFLGFSEWLLWQSLSTLARCLREPASTPKEMLSSKEPVFEEMRKLGQDLGLDVQRAFEPINPERAHFKCAS